MHPLVTHGGWVCTTCAVGGRVRKGNPSNFVQTLDMIPETPATGAADLDGFAAIPPTHWDERFSGGHIYPELQVRIVQCTARLL